MNPDRVTKILLAAIAIGLFLNAVPEAEALSHRLLGVGTSVVIVGAAPEQLLSPISVHCVNC